MKGQPRVLIVEDEPSMQTLLQYHLERAGFDVTLAVDGLEGKRQIEEQDFDIVCSDVMMSGIDGIELCRWAKGREVTRDLPFILLSSRAQTVDQEAGIQAGADIYLTKPFDVRKLMQTLLSLVEQQ